MNRLLHMLIALLAAVGFVRGTARAGDAPAADTAHTRCTLTVLAAPDSSMVFIDSVPMGYAPVTVDTLLPGLHRIRVQRPDLANWLATGARDSVLLGPGDAKTVQYRLQQWYSIVSFPAGALVYLGDSLRGTTPLLLPPQPDRQDTLFTLRKAGYEDARASLADAARGIVTVSLRQRWEADDRTGEALLTQQGFQERSSLRLYLSGAAAVLAGAASAYFKIRADNLNQQYLDSRDPSMQTRTKRLDTAAGLSLAAAEAGLILFSVFLLSE